MTRTKKNKIHEGKYANYFAVGYNAHEFIFDFGQDYSGNDQAELHTISLMKLLSSTFENSL